MTTKRFMVDDCGTLIDMTNRNTYDYVSDVCDLLNELHEENKEIKEELEHIQDSLWTVEYIKNVEEENKELIAKNNDLKFENEKKYRTIMQLEQMLQDVVR